MGSADYFADGQWNFYCDLCGKKAKSGTAMKTWDNHYVCAHHKEVRNPQDFIRGKAEQPGVPWTRPDPTPKTPANSILDMLGNPILDTSGDYILDTGI